MSGTKHDPEMSGLLKKYKEVCGDLNLDKTAADEALTSFQRIGINYTLEGDKLHWLACALYVACRNGTVPTVGGRGDYVEGNCVSLTRLLRSCKLSLVQFFVKMKKWSDMANLRHDMRNKIEHLERNFNVSTFIFNKYKPIFADIFKDPNTVVPKLTKSRKQSRKQLVSPGDVFSFCWTLFIHVKSNFSAISDDLVNSYHLLLACIDFCYSNALAADNAKDLLNSNFSELPADFVNDDYAPPDNVPCIIQFLCTKWQGIFVEAKGIKEHWWKPHVKRMVEKRQMKCRNPAQLIGFLDGNNYEFNFKNITKEYDQYVLNYGDFDERIFLCENAHEELGTPQASSEEFAERIQMKQKLEEARRVIPVTPLSNRQYLRNRDNIGSITPVSNATQTVSRLHSVLLGWKNEPSPTLVDIFNKCSTNPQADIEKRIKQLSDRFLEAYSKPLAEDQFELSNPIQNDFGQKRVELAVALYYKTLQQIMLREKKRLDETTVGNVLSSLLSHEVFHVSLFACCAEVVLFSYNSKRKFPWIMDVLSDYNNLHFQPFHFYKVIEPFIREDDGLSRDVVKHLNSVEEQILESMAWKTESTLWDLIRTHGPVPSCQDVAAPGSLEGNASSASPSGVKRFNNRETPFQSPVANLNASDRFGSPVNSSARRRLFDNGTKSANNEEYYDTSQHYVQITLPTQASTGAVRIIQMPAVAITIPQSQNTPSETANIPAAQPPRPAKAGPLGLFFRKVYHLAFLRLRDLCDRLNVFDDDLKRKVWTCFEISIRNNTELMKDRHLDQLIMCAIYSINKVTRRDTSFQDIMKCYRRQPQSQSHVYRSVLLTNRSRRNSASSDNSKNSDSSSPASSTQEDRDRIRSSSTLPVPHPNSQPPTPTRLAGTGSQFEFGEERGDLIMFYNQVYVPEMKKYIMKFSSESDSPPLSPLPRLASNPISPYRRVSTKHALYISPLKTANFPPSPNRPMSYCFLRSPAKDLRAINRMMRQNIPGSDKKISKRLLQEDSVDGENSPICKRLRGDATLMSKIQNIYTEMQGVTAGGDMGDSENLTSDAE